MSSAPATQAAERPAPIPFGRLVRVELRKAVDTRAGMWLLITIVGLSLIVILATAIAGKAVDQTVADLFGGALLPAIVLLPVLGILLVSSEFSARTALTTFALVPRRLRVITAKLAAGICLALVAAAAALATAAITGLFVSGSSVSGANDSSLTAFVGRGSLFLILAITCGCAFGLLLRSSPVAIVSYFFIPQLVGIAVTIFSSIQPASAWIVAPEAWGKLLDSDPMSGQHWARVGTTIGLWIVLPMAVGLVRLARGEIK